MLIINNEVIDLLDNLWGLMVLNSKYLKYNKNGVMKFIHAIKVNKYEKISLYQTI